jgi:DHA2 family multidrug resistance protein
VRAGGDIESMIVFRAIQGFIGGAMIPVTFAASFMMFPREWRNNISVLMGLVATMAPTIGPRSAAGSPSRARGTGCS